MSTVLRAFAIAVGVGALIANPTGVVLAKRPNIILILADDLGWKDLGCYGSTYHETPNLDALAKRGMRFTQAYSASPLCSPTRASILTGLYPARIGITSPACHWAQEILTKGLEPSRPGQPIRVARSLTRLRPEYTTLAELLAEAGYVTAHFGKWHLGHNGPYEPKDQGFAIDWPGTPQVPGPGGGYLAPWRFIKNPAVRGQPGEHIDERMALEAAQFIRENKNRPFFLNYWSYSVHAPWTAKPEVVEYFRKNRDPTAPQQNPVYAAMVKSLDNAVGTLLRAIDEAGLTEETIVIFFSDNGGYAYPPRNETDPPGWSEIPATSNSPLRSGKASIYEGGTRVPCLVVWPGKVQPGSTSDALLSSVDLFPTILEMCGLKPPAGIDGISQVSALLGQEAPRRAIFCHFPHGGRAQAERIDGFLPSAYLREGDWKLIRFFASGANGEDRYELYNLREDIGETRDRSAEEPQRVRVMAEKLADLLTNTEAVIPIYDPQTAQPPVDPKDPLLGWKLRGCTGTISGEILHLVANSPAPFLGFSAGQARGPHRVTFRIRVAQEGEGQIHYLPPSDRQPRRFWYTLHGTEFQTISVLIPESEMLGIIRIYLPQGANWAEIDWIELRSRDTVRRFDFSESK